VPAIKAKISITDRIFTRVGALDNLSRGQSTFMVEMEETANIVNNATEKSLVILDEIGRGTSTFDGLSIAWAVAEYLHDLNGGKGVKTLFATHYHELTRLETLKPRVKNYNIAVKEFNDNIIFLRRMVRGATNKSYGIQVARLAGVPENVVNRAKQILKSIESKANGSSPDTVAHVQAHEYKVDDKPTNIKRKKRRAPHGDESISEQMELFSTDNSRQLQLLTRIEALDISSMTPIEALNFLNEIHGELVSQPC